MWKSLMQDSLTNIMANLWSLDENIIFPFVRYVCVCKRRIKGFCSYGTQVVFGVHFPRGAGSTMGRTKLAPRPSHKVDSQRLTFTTLGYKGSLLWSSIDTLDFAPSPRPLSRTPEGGGYCVTWPNLSPVAGRWGDSPRPPWSAQTTDHVGCPCTFTLTGQLTTTPSVAYRLWFCLEQLTRESTWPQAYNSIWSTELSWLICRSTFNIKTNRPTSFFLLKNKEMSIIEAS